MKGHNFRYMNHDYPALAGTLVNGSAANGVELREPWLDARQATLIVTSGSVGAGSLLSITIEGKLRSDDTTWEPVVDKDGNGAANLAFVASLLAPGGELDTRGSTRGSMSLERFDSEKYVAIRCTAAEANGVAVQVGASWVLSDLRRGGSEVGPDGLLYRQRYGTDTEL